MCQACGKVEQREEHLWVEVGSGTDQVVSGSWSIDCTDWQEFRCSHCGSERREVIATYTTGR